MRKSISTKSKSKWPLSFSHFEMFRQERKGEKMKETMLKLDSLQKSERGNLKWIAPIMTGIYCSVITAMPALANSQTIIQGIGCLKTQIRMGDSILLNYSPIYGEDG